MTSGSRCKDITVIVLSVLLIRVGIWWSKWVDESFAQTKRARIACEARMCRSGAHAKIQQVGRFDYKCLCVEEPIDGR